MGKDTLHENVEWLDFYALSNENNTKPLAKGDFMPLGEGDLADIYEFHSPINHLIDDVMASMNIFGDAKAFRDFLQIIQENANRLDPFLMEGDRGTGKKMMARLLHKISPRRANSCLILDCRQLFKTIGRSLRPEIYLRQIHAAPNSYVVLDHPEILPLELRNIVLTPLYDQKTLNSPRLVLIVDSSAIPTFLNGLEPSLRQALQNNTAHVPNLHERRSDLRNCILSKLRELNHQSNQHKRLSANALERLTNYDYRMNFITLNSVLEKLHATQAEIITFDETLVKSCQQDGTNWLVPKLGNGFNLDDYISRVRQRIIWDALETAGYNQTRAARLLGLTPQAINKFLHLQKFDRSKL